MTEEAILTHKFTDSGLGQAPFRIIGFTENAFNLGDGTTKAGGTCDHCWTGIRWEVHIVSADGIRSKIGTDCARKVGDHKLTAKVKQEVNRRRREAAQAKREEKRLAELQAQRDRNNGLTDWEVTEAKLKAEKIAADLAKQPIKDLLAPLADHLEDGRGGFRDSVAHSLRNGDLPTESGLNIATEILAKAAGRRNSAAFNEEFIRIEAIFQQALELEN